MHGEITIDPRHALTRHLLGDAQARDEEFFLDRAGKFGCKVVAEPTLELREDRVLGIAAVGDREGHVELVAIGLVQLLQPFVIGLGQRVDARDRLLELRRRRDVLRLHGPVADVRKLVEEGQLLFARRRPESVGQGLMERSHGQEWPLGEGRFRHPRRQFIGIAEGRHESGLVHAVDLGQCQGGLDRRRLGQSHPPRRQHSRQDAAGKRSTTKAAAAGNRQHHRTSLPQLPR